MILRNKYYYIPERKIPSFYSGDFNLILAKTLLTNNKNEKNTACRTTGDIIAHESKKCKRQAKSKFVQVNSYLIFIFLCAGW